MHLAGVGGCAPWASECVKRGLSRRRRDSFAYSSREGRGKNKQRGAQTDPPGGGGLCGLQSIISVIAKFPTSAGRLSCENCRRGWAPCTDPPGPVPRQLIQTQGQEAEGSEKTPSTGTGTPWKERSAFSPRGGSGGLGFTEPNLQGTGGPLVTNT